MTGRRRSSSTSRSTTPVARDAELGAQADRGLPGRHLRRRRRRHARIVEENLDECVLCDLCLERRRRARCACSSSTTRAPRCSASERPPRRSGAHGHAPAGRLLRMPELPEAERARTTIERGALLRRIVARRRRRQLRLPPARARRDRRRARRPRADRRAPPRQGDVGRDLGRRAGARPAPRAWPGASRSTRSRRPRLGPLRRALRGRRHGWPCATSAGWAARAWSPTSPPSGPTPPRSGATSSARAWAAGARR